MDYIQNLLNKYPNLNKIVIFLKTNKYNAFFIVAIVLLLFMLVGMIAFIASPTNKSKNNNTQNNNNKTTNTSAQETVPTPENLSITTPNPTEAANIENQVQPQITPLVAVPYTVTSITKYGNTWGSMTLDNPNANIGAVIIKNINGKWKIVAGPGTYFPQKLLQSEGIPTQVLGGYSAPSPSISLSPSPTDVPDDIQ